MLHPNVHPTSTTPLLWPALMALEPEQRRAALDMHKVRADLRRLRSPAKTLFEASCKTASLLRDLSEMGRLEDYLALLSECWPALNDVAVMDEVERFNNRPNQIRFSA
jgi:hypothetical protein